MTIHFIGLSCFLIENAHGFRILVDPFNDSPAWTLGPLFPKEFNGKPFGANVVLMSEPDADHAREPGEWLQHAPKTKPNSDPFPNLNLRGTVVYEFNGDVNIAWHYTTDGIRIAHFADNAHVLTTEQLKEFGSLDIVFMSPPKVIAQSALDVVRNNISLLKPKIIVWAHHIAPKNLPLDENPENLRNFFAQYFKNNANTNKYYEDNQSFMQLCSVYENALILNKECEGKIIDTSSLVIDRTFINQIPKKSTSILFRSMIASSPM